MDLFYGFYLNGTEFKEEKDRQREKERRKIKRKEKNGGKLTKS